MGDAPDDVFTTIAANQGDTEAELTVKYSYKDGYKTSWQRKVSGSFKIGAKAEIKVPLVAKGEVSTEVLVGGDTTDGTENSHETTKESSYKVKVPPHSEVEVKTTTIDYTISFSLTGSVRTNYNPTVDGHYFWSGQISAYPNFLRNIKSEIGTIKGTNCLEVNVVNSPAKRIN